MWHTVFRLFSATLACLLVLAIVFATYWLFQSEEELKTSDKIFIPLAMGVGFCYVILFSLFALNKFKKGVAAFCAWLILPWCVLLAVDGYRIINSLKANNAPMDIPVEGIVLGLVVLAILIIIGLAGRKVWYKELLLMTTILLVVAIYFVWEVEYKQYVKETMALNEFVLKFKRLSTGTEYKGKVCIPPLAEISEGMVEKRIQYEMDQVAPLFTYLPDAPPIDRFLSEFKQTASSHDMEITQITVDPKVEDEFFTHIKVTGTVSGDKLGFQKLNQIISDGDWIVKWDEPVPSELNRIKFSAKLYGYKTMRAPFKKRPGMCAHKISRVWLPPYTWKIEQKEAEANEYCGQFRKYETAYHQLQKYHQIKNDILGRIDVFNSLKTLTTNARIRNQKFNFTIPCLQ